MIVGQVIGSVWATRKEEALTGVKLLLVKTLSPSKSIMVAADRIGAGVGDQVIVAKGSSARKVLENPDNPLDASIVAIVDQMEIAESYKEGAIWEDD